MQYIIAESEPIFEKNFTNKYLATSDADKYSEPQRIRF